MAGSSPDIPSWFEVRNEGEGAVVRSAEDLLGGGIPYELVRLYTAADGGEGPASDDLYVVLWPADEVAELNAVYKDEADFAQDYLLIGTDGGNEAFAIRAEDSMFVSFPIIGFSLDVVDEYGLTVEDFFANVAKPRNP